MTHSTLRRRSLLAAGLAAPALAMGSRARAQGAPIKIGVLCDMSDIYADDTGPGLVAGVQVAVNELGGKIGNRPLQVLSADDKNKPDVGADVAAQWLDKDGVSAIVCASASSITLAVASLCKARNKALLICGSLSADLTGSQCSPMSFQFSLDTYAGPKSVIAPTIREYLKQPPTKAEIETLLDQVGGEAVALIRDGEAEFKALGKKKAELTRADIVKAIAAHPVLLQRPIVVKGKRAAIGRPPEAVLPLLK